MKLIKVHAYLQQNVGDDLMVELLVRRYPQCRFWGCRGQQKKTVWLSDTAQYFDNEDVFKKWGRWNHLVNRFTPYTNRVYNQVLSSLNNKCICGVVIGGSIYRELKGQSLEQRMVYEEAKSAPGSPCFILGANFGPYYSEAFYSHFRKYFSQCEGVSFRDQESYILFKDIPRIQWAPDIVFNVPLGEVCDGNRVIISVINIEKRGQLIRYNSAYISKMIDVCGFWVQRGKTPVLTSFCQYEEDDVCVDKIYNLLPANIKAKTEIYCYSGDTDEVIELFRKAHFVIATRFHAMILAMRFQKPLFTISYELKTDNVLADTKSTAFSALADLWAYSPECMYEMGRKPVRINEYVKEAERQFRYLDEFLEQNG